MTDDEQKDFTRMTFPKGAPLVTEGERGDAAYVIVEGKVEIRKSLFGVSPRVLATRSKGDVIGEMALFDDKPHMASAVAVEETVVNAMSRDEFLKRLEGMDPVMRGIMNMMVERAREMAEDLMHDEGEVDWAHWRREEGKE